jgi:hypothetical protein
MLGSFQVRQLHGGFSPVLESSGDKQIAVEAITS